MLCGVTGWMALSPPTLSMSSSVGKDGDRWKRKEDSGRRGKEDCSGVEGWGVGGERWRGRGEGEGSKQSRYFLLWFSQSVCTDS